MKLRIFIIFLSFTTLLFNSCSNSNHKNQEVIIFHAGSLSVPLHIIADSFMVKNPTVSVLLEGAGSRQCARKITDLNKPCDIIASADYTVIEDLLIPDFTKWYISFASNEMCLAYTQKSRLHEKISDNNWFNILLNDSIIYGRSNPDLDPCGYRTILTLRLANIYYRNLNLSNKILEKDRNYIRPKEVDLLSLLESNTIDYIFIYRSVAEQHGLSYLILPDEINLKKDDKKDFYKKAKVQISGKKQGETIIKHGEPMVYALSILKDAPNKALANKFLQYMLSPKGLEILRSCGQPTIIPDNNIYYNYIPKSLKKFVKPMFNEE